MSTAGLQTALRWRRIGPAAGLLAVIALTLAGMAIFGRGMAGDAVVHLVIAERMSEGQWFDYNGLGEHVSASTSPLWTLILTAAVWVSPDRSPWFLKVLACMVWIAQAVLAYQVVFPRMGIRPVPRLAGTIWWITCPPVVINSLSGMENAAVALGVLLLLVVVYEYITGRMRTVPFAIAFGFIALGLVATRPEAAAWPVAAGVALLVLGVPAEKPRRTTLLAVSVAALITLAGLIPWLAWQYHFTGTLVTDSSRARLVLGQQTASVHLAGFAVHTKAALYVGGFLLPAAVGTAVVLSGAVRRRLRNPEDILVSASAVAIVVTILFYTVVTGAQHVGRYTLPLVPFIFALGAEGLWRVGQHLRCSSRSAMVGMLPLLFGTLWFVVAGISEVDRRGTVVGYGLSAVVDAPSRRIAYTDALLESLGLEARTDPARIAVTEVQLRWFTDDRVEVLSLDGRSSPQVLDFLGKDKCPDFEAFFQAVRPDAVQLGQWGKCGSRNLVAQWEAAFAGKPAGTKIDWEDAVITAVGGEGYVRIHWADAVPAGRGE